MFDGTSLAFLEECIIHYWLEGSSHRAIFSLGVFTSSSLCTCLSLCRDFPFYKGYQLYWVRPPLWELHLTLTTSVKMVLLNKTLGTRTSTYCFGRQNSTFNTRHLFLILLLCFKPLRGYCCCCCYNFIDFWLCCVFVVQPPSCGKWELLFSAVHGLLIVMASFLVEHTL